jgi:anti-sigma regulatory factor (Ser/Thr protein kinase)/anti-anti-sigma regulatory factor
VVVQAGGAVLLYSDGVIERPGASTEQGRQWLLTTCQQAAAAGSTHLELIDTLMNGLAAEALADDVALLVVCYPLLRTTPLLVELPATPEQLTPLRLHLRRWLEQSGISEDDVIPVQIAAGEAAANAVEHAYTTVPAGTVTLSAELTDESTVRICVQDHGRWCGPAPEPGSRGRGLLLMQQCMDNVHVHQSTGGTTVELIRRVCTSDGRGSALPSTIVADAAPTLRVDIATTAAGKVGVLRGDLDASSASTAGVALRGAARGGVLPLTIDLIRLAHLTSAGVKLLFDLADEANSSGNQLTVQVLRGSAAHHVLELTGFPDLATLAIVDLAAAS